MQNDAAPTDYPPAPINATTRLLPTSILLYNLEIRNENRRKLLEVVCIKLWGELNNFIIVLNFPAATGRHHSFDLKKLHHPQVSHW